MINWRIIAFITIARLVISESTLYIRSSDGDFVRCVDKLHQKAFNNSLLTNHKFQELPSEIPQITKKRKKSTLQTWEAQIDTAKCPEGTIPIRSDGVTLDRQTNPNSYTSGHESDAYKKTGCYNLECDFIQTSNTIVVGGALSPISSLESHQFEITILVWKDQKSGNWWLSLGSNNSLVGYWPAELFTRLGDFPVKVEWGGEVTNSRSFGRHTTTQMGSGRYPDKGFGAASYFRDLEIVYNNNSLQPVQNLELFVDDSRYYDIKKSYTEEWGTHFFLWWTRIYW